MPLERLFITCGGTGGHFYPGLAVAHKFQQNGGKVTLLLSGVNAKAQAEIAHLQGINAEILPFMTQPKKKPFKFIFGLLGGILKTLRLTAKYKPQAILCMGSFASLPPVVGTKLLRVPLFIHDGNARVGKANRFFSSSAVAAAAAFPCVNQEAVKAPLTVTGMPSRQKLIDNRHLDKNTAIAELNRMYHANLDANLKTILVFGGSQGAMIFNDYFPQAFRAIEERSFQILHLCGKGKKESPEKIYSGAKFPYLLLESSEAMELFLAAADIAVCRSGGSSLAELALFGLPAVLIPFPESAEGHQEDNARVFENENAAVLVLNQHLTAEKAKELAINFLDEPEKWHIMAKNMESLARPNATEDLLAIIENAI